MFNNSDFELVSTPKDYYDTNPYYNPETWGLTYIGGIELEEPNYSFNTNYSFDTLVIWKRADGKVFYAQDRGYSCSSSPFEDFHTYSQLVELTKDSLGTLRNILRDSPYAMSHGAQDLLYRVRDALRR